MDERKYTRIKIGKTEGETGEGKTKTQEFFLPDFYVVKKHCRDLSSSILLTPVSGLHSSPSALILRYARLLLLRNRHSLSAVNSSYNSFSRIPFGSGKSLKYCLKFVSDLITDHAVKKIIRK